MSGNVIGGKKAAIKNLANDPDFYRKIGRIGGTRSNNGGFFGNEEKASKAGVKGGSRSRRGFKLLSANSEYGVYRQLSTGKVVRIQYKQPPFFKRLLTRMWTL